LNKKKAFDGKNFSKSIVADPTKLKKEIFEYLDSKDNDEENTA
jgi:hypothetical protein